MQCGDKMTDLCGFSGIFLGAAGLPEESHNSEKEEYINITFPWSHGCTVCWLELVYSRGHNNLTFNVTPSKIDLSKYNNTSS